DPRHDPRALRHGGEPRLQSQLERHALASLRRRGDGPTRRPVLGSQRRAPLVGHREQHALHQRLLDGLWASLRRAGFRPGRRRDHVLRADRRNLRVSRWRSRAVRPTTLRPTTLRPTTPARRAVRLTSRSTIATELSVYGPRVSSVTPRERLELPSVTQETA